MCAQIFKRQWSNSTSDRSVLSVPMLVSSRSTVVRQSEKSVRRAWRRACYAGLLRMAPLLRFEQSARRAEKPARRALTNLKACSSHRVSVRAWPGCVCLDEGVHLPAHDGFELDRPDQARGVEERAVQREGQEIRNGEVDPGVLIEGGGGAKSFSDLNLTAAQGSISQLLKRRIPPPSSKLKRWAGVVVPPSFGRRVTPLALPTFARQLLEDH